MATKKISELEAINAAEDNDILVIVDTSESTTNKITKGNLLIGAGHTIEMTLNENYQIVLVLKNAAGTALSTQTIDLPNENAVTNLAYNNGILTVTKQSGATSQINLTGLIEGLVTESDFNTFKEALQTTLEAINEKDAEQDEAIAENYKVINKLNEKLEDQQKVIDQLPQVTGQGTEVTLENTIEAPFTKFDVEGNSVQDGTPSPDNEVPIYSAGDNENEFNPELAEDKKYQNIDGNYSIATHPLMWISGLQSIESFQSYILNYQAQTGAFYDENRNVIKSSPIYQSNTFQAPSNAKYVNLTFAPSIVTFDDKDNIKLEKGNKATPYSPYGMGSINEKIQTRNVFKNLPNTLDNYSIVMNNDGKKITFKGTNSSSTFYPSFIFYADGSVATSQWHPTKQQIDKSKGYFTKTGIAYILSLLKSGTFSGSNPSFFIGKETTFTSSGIFANVDTYTTQIANNSEKVNFIAIGFTPSQQVDLTFKIQLEPGSTENSYVEHKEQDYSIFVQQPIRSIGDVRDLFFKNTVDNPYYDENLTLNGWYERHYINRKIFDGTENWQFSTGSGVAGIYMLNPPIDDMVQGNFLDGLSNYFHNDKSGKGKNSIRFGGNNNNVIYIYVDSNEFPDKTSFTSWLAEKYASGHPLYIDYISAEPLDLPCTPEQVEQIENKPSTYKDFTIINSEDETPAYLEVSGIRDIDTMFDKVTNAIVSLGGNV